MNTIKSLAFGFALLLTVLLEADARAATWVPLDAGDGTSSVMRVPELNRGPLAGDGYVNSIYLAVYGRNATDAELSKWRGGYSEIEVAESVFSELPTNQTGGNEAGVTLTHVGGGLFIDAALDGGVYRFTNTQVVGTSNALVDLAVVLKNTDTGNPRGLLAHYPNANKWATFESTGDWTENAKNGYLLGLSIGAYAYTGAVVHAWDPATVMVFRRGQGAVSFGGGRYYKNGVISTSASVSDETVAVFKENGQAQGVRVVDGIFNEGSSHIRFSTLERGILSATTAPAGTWQLNIRAARPDLTKAIRTKSGEQKVVPVILNATIFLRSAQLGARTLSTARGFVEGIRDLKFSQALGGNGILASGRMYPLINGQYRFAVEGQRIGAWIYDGAKYYDASFKIGVSHNLGYYAGWVWSGGTVATVTEIGVGSVSASEVAVAMVTSYVRDAVLPIILANSVAWIGGNDLPRVTNDAVFYANAMAVIDRSFVYSGSTVSAVENSAGPFQFPDNFLKIYNW